MAPVRVDDVGRFGMLSRSMFVVSICHRLAWGRGNHFCMALCGVACTGLRFVPILPRRNLGLRDPIRFLVVTRVSDEGVDPSWYVSWTCFERAGLTRLPLRTVVYRTRLS